MFRLRASATVPVATIVVPSGVLREGEEIIVEHASDASAAWRATTLSLATCLPQLGVGSAFDVRLPM
jgi:hypothetical protein